MLGIQRLEHLAANLGVEKGDLLEAAEYADDYVSKFTVYHPSDPSKPETAKKPRPVISVTGKLRDVQCRLYNRVLKAKLTPSAHSHGGIGGRHVLTNARPHLGQRYLFLADIAGFFPSITNDRVNQLFLRRFKCSPTVARLLTRICTHNYHLALGLVTSPILADQVLHDVDMRIAKLCSQHGLVYTRYVDDVAVSGKFDLEPSFVPKLVWKIFREHHFRIRRDKTKFGRVADGIGITKISLAKGRPDVVRSYIQELVRRLDDHASLARGGPFVGPFQSDDQLRGKVQYVCWVNPGRRLRLFRKFRAVPWYKMWNEAVRRGLVKAEPQMRKRDEPAPSFAHCFGATALAPPVRNFRDHALHGVTEPPF